MENKLVSLKYKFTLVISILLLFLWGFLKELKNEQLKIGQDQITAGRLKKQALSFIKNTHPKNSVNIQHALELINLAGLNDSIFLDRHPYSQGNSPSLVNVLKSFKESAITEQEFSRFIIQEIKAYEHLEKLIEANNNTIEQKFNLYSWILILLILSIQCIMIYNYNKTISEPINKILKSVSTLKTGNINCEIDYHSNEKLGEIAKCINAIIHNQKELAVFAENIGAGKFNYQYSLLGEHDKLGNSLTNMAERLSNVSEEERKRAWTTEGLAKFSDVLRAHNDNLEELCTHGLHSLIKYTRANQGKIYIVKEEAQDIRLKLKAAYAWDRKKNIQEDIDLGEGLIGQAAMELETIYLTDIPEDYIKITSGLGESNPGSILILPLKSNDALCGMIEMAYFEELKPFEIEFAEKAGDAIASSIASARINEKTRLLLDESRLLAKNLQSQEEELRQNTEELRATQENLHIKLEEAKEEMRQQIIDIESEKNKNISILEGCVDGVITFDQEGKIEYFNKSAEAIWNVSRENVLNKNIRELIKMELKVTDSDMHWEYLNGQQRKVLDIRTEINIFNNNHEESAVLITISKSKYKNQYLFTAFVQSISVELF
ncbi:GAF Sensor Hybrid Histidine Kinase, putative [Sporocytophaga myxococcoides]|uniref:GAF Sensor Hybrid Histidine Kinase, putative n=1 Tax=Sporocytophaga myxococcoides TaxID=153721 RepID=A0A098LMA3_9BACT|nr:GAF domain-containing protein [Sporocytophaga myxococcoides]GAL87634.1 GAF Sensor Hybrid Histidine Kinase, putative [Sporocytophaga myxococcoides]